MKKIFLENVTDLGDLYYMANLYEYEGIPICFLCENKSGAIVLGHCCEVRDLRRWILVKVNLTNLKQLAQREISLHSALTLNKTVVEAEYNYETKKSTSEVKQIHEVDQLNLPEQDIFLEAFEQEALFSFLEEKIYITEIVVNVKASDKEFYRPFNKNNNSYYKLAENDERLLSKKSLKSKVIVA